MSPRVVIALSGGVDSSVAAALLLEQGFEVVALTLQLFDCSDQVNERSCCGVAGVAEARAAAGRLGIRHYVINGRERFREVVLAQAWREYERGRTPNPCVACNDTMKFGLLYERARELGADFVATGHHARVVREPTGGGRPWLLRGRDADKDQSYFLFSLSDEQLRVTRFPIGELTKAEVRERARGLLLPNAARAESQDACIAQRSDLAESLREAFGGAAKPGRFVDRGGRVLGEHDGVHRFTVGQRKGLGVALGARAYVVSIDATSGDVVIDTDVRSLESVGLVARAMRWHDEVAPGERRACQVKVRYRHEAVQAELERAADGDGVLVRFAEPERAVTPGQAAVLYDGERVIGGGWIDRALPAEERAA
ncbi:MAG: tRNA 2-thiouridine(34) synthase MnmA [Myxococcales bacterium]|nr:tRNA 2-thiouridine(34) synthase MnmA [Myxococcales bacterium]